MAENVLDSGPPSAKRPKLSSPALSASASDGNGKYLFFIFYFHDTEIFESPIACFVYTVAHLSLLSGHSFFPFSFVTG